MNAPITKVKFSHSPSFEEVRKYAKEYFILRDVSAHGFYSIVLELSANGKVNTHLPHLM